ncbi:MAG: hypothetical protein KDJ52_28430 [Anaerolineae bacterium]|nr:hypothetical protein [Anaerolineae bacterium]
MIRHILAFLISPLIGLASCSAYACLVTGLDIYIIRPYWSLPTPEDDFPYGPGLAVIFLMALFAAYFLTATIGFPSVFFLTWVKRDNFRYFVLTGLGVGIVLGVGLGLLIMQPGDAIWYWLLVISFPIVGSLGAYISCWLIVNQSKVYF